MVLIRRSLLVLVSASLAGCASPSPEISRVAVRPPSNPDMAALDLSGLRNIDAVKAGKGLATSTRLIPPGDHTIYFSFGAVKGQPGRCLNNKSSRTMTSPMEKLAHGDLIAEASETRAIALKLDGTGVGAVLVLPVIVGVGTVWLTCRVVSAGKDEDRRCYRVKFTAKKGQSYVPRISGGKPVIVDGRKGDVVSNTESVDCAQVDRLQKRALKQRREGATDQGTIRPEAMLRMAKAGNPQAQYDLSMRLKSQRKSWFWLCRAAHGRHRYAQVLVGDRYEKGNLPVTKDLVAAYKWYMLADANGYIGARIFAGELAKKMTPAQIVRAKSSVAQWRPNPHECIVGRRRKRP